MSCSQTLESNSFFAQRSIKRTTFFSVIHDALVHLLAERRICKTSKALIFQVCLSGKIDAYFYKCGYPNKELCEILFVNLTEGSLSVCDNDN